MQEMGAAEAVVKVAGSTVVEGAVEIVGVVVLQREDVTADLEMIDIADLGLLERDQVVGSKAHAEE